MTKNAKKRKLFGLRFLSGATCGTRTRDPRLGKPMLYQLS